MVTIAQLLDMPVGEKIGGGFILTVKATKKDVELPDKRGFIFTVILLDETGEILADFRTPRYLPLIKNEQIKIIVAQIQAADPSSNKIALKDAKKLYVDQFEKLTQTLSEYENQLVNYQEDWNIQIKGKIRHGIVCSMIQTGFTANEIFEKKESIEKLVEYVFTGEQK